MSQGVEDREREFFDRHYEEEVCHPTGLALRMKRELRSLRRRAQGRRIGRVLSIGCGDGLFEALLAPFAESIVGIDLSEEAVARARARAASQGLRNLEFRCVALSELRWDESFDAIVCLAFLHHVPEAELPDLFASVHAHLRPGGFLYAQDPNRRAWLRGLGRRLLGSRYGRYHSADERELDPREIEARLSQAGFASVEIDWIDVTLIPAQYLLPRAPAWLMRACALFDRAFCATPLARWASGFTVFATRAGGAPPG
jgi:2-polyprenyl-6-hydroxyphenyl methylase/3-demethylubiquinone-9 3-methyltransferase